MYPNTCFQKNLRIPETGANFSLNLFLNKIKIINLLDITEFDNSCNIPLLKKHDKCTETIGQISFLPLEFLENYMLQEKYIDKPFEAENKLELKKKYVLYLSKMNVFNNNFFLENKYNNIPLYFFRKEYLSASLSKTVDVALIEEEEDYNRNDFLDITKILYKTYKLDEVNIKNQNEWLHKNDLINLLTRKLLSIKDNLINNVCFLPFVYLKNPLYNIDYMYSDILNGNFLSMTDMSKRYNIFIILYKSHFTSVIIDNNLETNNGKKKIAFFFNSCGYNPNYFNSNKNFWFIDNSCKIINLKKLNTKYDNHNNYYMPIEAFCLILKEKLGVTNFVFNTYSIQNFDSECGIFSSMFLYFFLDMINKKKNIDILAYKYLYFNLLNLGFDLTYSMLRGLLFFTQEDMDLNQINENIYKDSAFVYPIKNKKFKEYIKIYYKNLLNFEKINNDIKNSINLFYSKYNNILK